MARKEEQEEVSTLIHHKFDPTPQVDAVFVLIAIGGPDKGARFEVNASSPQRTLAGQSPACDIRLTDREVSRRHAVLEPTGERLRITDLGSKNGTFVDHLAIADAYVQGGEVLRMGSSSLRVERVADSPGRPLGTETRFGRLIGASREMRRLYPLCKKLALSDVPVLLEGETGTGKEVLAESLHEQGPRAAGPFVVFDCTGVPANLIESELFGHERGAFTGAIAARKGLFEQAHGGTLLIDEIGDLEINLQSKLLRVVERSEVRRLGGDRWIRVDVRVLAATRRDLDREVQAGRFRDDLFHRLVVARIELPPLRKRRGDIPILVRQFCGELNAPERIVGHDLISRWEEYAWPGNVRELRNAVARHVALGELAGDDDRFARPSQHPVTVAPLRTTDVSAPDASLHGHDFMQDVLNQKLPYLTARQRVVDEFQHRYLSAVLAEHGGNVVHAAAASGIARRYFQILRARHRK